MASSTNTSDNTESQLNPKLAEIFKLLASVPMPIDPTDPDDGDQQKQEKPTDQKTA